MPGSSFLKTHTMHAFVVNICEWQSYWNILCITNENYMLVNILLTENHGLLSLRSQIRQIRAESGPNRIWNHDTAFGRFVTVSTGLIVDENWSNIERWADKLCMHFCWNNNIDQIWPLQLFRPMCRTVSVCVTYIYMSHLLRQVTQQRLLALYKFSVVSTHAITPIADPRILYNLLVFLHLSWMCHKLSYASVLQVKKTNCFWLKAPSTPLTLSLYAMFKYNHNTHGWPQTWLIHSHT